MATPPLAKSVQSPILDTSPLIPPPPELVDRMRGTGWAPVITSPAPLRTLLHRAYAADFAHFWLERVATGFRVLGISQLP